MLEKADATPRSVRRNQAIILTRNDTSGMVGTVSQHNGGPCGLHRRRLSRESKLIWYWNRN